MSDSAYLKGALEAILMVADSPVPAARLAETLSLDEAETVSLLREIARSCAGQETQNGEGYLRGFQLREAAGGWRFYSHPRFADVVGEYATAGQNEKLSVQALETLAVIAYRQPVTRSQIAAVRGVEVDSVVRTLLMRGLIRKCATVPQNGAGLYETTDCFLEKMGLKSLSDLPDLAPYLPDNEALEDIEKEIL